MRRTEDTLRGIRWSLFSNIDDLDLADDLALYCCPTHINISGRRPADSKTFGQQVGLRISTKKTETMMLKVNMPDPVKVNRTDLQQTNKFTYLGSIIKLEGSTKEDIHSRLGKARSVFREMNNVGRSTQYSIKTKLKQY